MFTLLKKRSSAYTIKERKLIVPWSNFFKEVLDMAFAKILVIIYN